MSEVDDRSGVTRRQLLAGSSGLALAASVPLTTGCGASKLAQVPAAARAAALNPTGAVRDGALWEQFCEALKPLARHVTGDAAGDDMLARAEGIRCLSRLVSLGLDRFLEYGDPLHPDFYDLQTPTRKYMGDNPDQSYRVASIDGSLGYTVRGQAKGAAGVEVGVYAGTFRSDGQGGGRRMVASRDESDLEIASDGSYTITLGPNPGDGNHLELAPDASSLLIRTYFWDRELRLHHPMQRIERVDAATDPPMLTPEALVRGLLGTVAFVDGSLDWWNNFQGSKTRDNELIVMPDDGSVQTPSLVRYLNGVVALDPEQALVLEFEPKDEPGYWSWVLQNIWGETPDWRYRPIVRNNRELVREADGRIRIVIAHRNPGVANWMDMAGHAKLLLSLRWRGASPLPEVSTTVVPVGQSG